MTRRPTRLIGAAVACAAALSGCGFKGVYSLPLPGAAANHGDTYTVKVELADVLDLVPYSAVKVNAATVGHVKSITLDHGHALVTCKLVSSARLPANAVAKVEQTSVLGEKFVELEPPTGTQPRGRLANGDTIPLARSSTDASIEEVLGALSALLNGGGVQQIRTIARELNTALDGRTGVTRDLLNRFTDFASGLNDQKADIIRAIEGLDHFARTVKSQEHELIGAIDSLPPALRILTDDRRRLTKMLVSVQHLGDVGARVINASKRSTIANLRDLQPTLNALSKVGTELPKTLSIIITYPTADSVEQEYFGDYGNLSLTVDLSGQSLVRYLKGVQLSTITSPLLAKPNASAKSGKLTAAERKAARLQAQRAGIAKALEPITRWSTGSTINDMLTGVLK